jgi:4-hydroxymandelate synthase
MGNEATTVRLADRTGESFGDVSIDHLLFLVADVSEWTEDLVDGYGLSELARGVLRGGVAHCPAVLVGSSGIRIVLGQVSDEDDDASVFVRKHGDAVADIALSTADVAGAFDAAVRRGGRPVCAPAVHDGVVTATIGGVGDLVHTLVQAGRPDDLLPGLAPVGPACAESRMTEVDHVAICVEAGELREAVRYYNDVFDFRTIFEERIDVGAQTMESAVVQSRSGEVTFTLLEPDPKREPGQIDDFLKNHGGAGVQHVALSTDDIVSTVDILRRRNVGFLAAPPAYYDLVGNRIAPVRHSVDQLRRLDILVDEDHAGQLFQIFARAVHSRRTYFFELIERAGAVTFGAGNVRSLYESRELELRVGRGE